MLDFIRQFRGMIFKKKDNSATPLVYSSTQEGAIYNNNNAEMRTQIGGADRAVVTDSQSQTLTNKTLTSPVINSPTGIVKGDVGLGNVDNTSDATKNAATADLTNKTINANLNTITNLTTSNLSSGVLNVSSVLSGATDAQIPSAQAVKTYVDNSVASKDQASEISYSNTTSGLAATNVQDAIDEVDGNVDNLVTLSGVALDAVNLGAFTGTTIPDNQTNKQAFQALETAHENHTGASSSVHGVTGSVVGTSDSQALTNKTIVVSSNTITTAASGNLAAVELNAALAELQGDIDSRATSTELSNHINNVSGAHAASAISNTPSGNLAAITVQAALNELQSDIDTRALSVGGSIQSPVRLDVKKDTKANLLTYAATASNGQLCFATDTKEMFQVLDGALVSVGSGGTSNVDALLTQTFDESALTDFTQTGLALIETNPMNGKKTARLIHQAATTQSFKYVKAVDPKYRGKNLTMSFQVRSSATAGNVTLNIYDETNVANIISSQSITLGSVTVSATTNSNTTLSGISSSDINKLKVGQTVTGSGIATGTTISAVSVSALTATLSQAATASATVTLKVSDLPQKQSASFDVPNNCASISYTISALAESGLPETYVDDVVIQLTSVALTSTSVTVPVNNDTDWASYTPTFTGFGTVTGIAFFYKRQGSDVLIRGRFTEGTTTATEARVSLPTGLISSSAIVTLEIAGNAVTNTPDSASYHILREPNVNYATFGRQVTSTYNGLAKRLGTQMDSGSATYSIEARIPIQGWVENETTSKTIPLTSAVFATQPDSQMTWQGYAGFGSTRTYIPYFTNARSMTGSAFSWTSSAANGLEITIQEDGYFNIAFTANCNVSSSTQVAIGKNLSSFVAIPSATNLEHIAYSYGGGSSNREGTTAVFNGPLKVGDKIYPLLGSAPTQVPTDVMFSIAKVGSTKQINISSDQKIDLPSSELRMGLYNGCGSTNTRVAKFTSVEKLVGDAFTIVNDPALGFSLTMKKSGFIDLSFFSGTNAAYKTISRNATQLSTDPTSMTAGQNLSNDYYEGTVSWSGKCNIGDVFRAHVASAAAALGTASNLGSSFNAFFQEDKVQVSLSNVLPQFTQSDSSVILNTLQSGSSSYGSTNTAIYRFSNVETNIGSDIVYTDSATLGASFRIMTDGLYNVSWSGVTDGTSTLGISKNSSQLTTDVLNINSADRIAHASMGAGGVDICASAQVYLLAGDIVRPHGPVANSVTVRNARNKFSISKVGKPNLTSVDVTPFTNYKGTDTEFIRLTGGNSYGSTGTCIRRFATTAENTNKGVLQYVDDPINGAYFKALKNCTASFAWNDIESGSGSAVFGFSVNSTQVSTRMLQITDGYLVGSAFYNNQGTNSSVTTSAVVKLNVGDIVRPHSDNLNAFKSDGLYSTASQTLRTSLEVSAVAEADQIVSPISSFSSDTASLVYAPSTSYTPSTLANAPVGTFITFTYGANTNTRTQTTTAPTQTVSDMNVNGFLIYSRAYQGASTAAQPSTFAIQIGKGLKGVTKDLYKSSGKTVSGSLDYVVFNGTANTVGMCLQGYEENTGILYLDAGYSVDGAISTAQFQYNDGARIGSGYVVINASKSPSLAAVPQLQPRIAVLRDEKASGTAGGTNGTGYQTRTLNTIDDQFGIVTSLASNQFVLPAGTYAMKGFGTMNGTQGTRTRIRNITAGTTSILGQSAYGGSVTSNGPSYFDGVVTITTASTFELQQYFAVSQGTNGLGENAGSGENNVYALVEIQKIK